MEIHLHGQILKYTMSFSNLKGKKLTETQAKSSLWEGRAQEGMWLTPSLGQLAYWLRITGMIVNQLMKHEFDPYYLPYSKAEVETSKRSSRFRE